MSAVTAVEAIPAAVERSAGPDVAAHGRLLRDAVLYGLCSAVALLVDWGALTLLSWRGMPAPAAAAIGFCLGMAVTYAASVTIVFAGRRRTSPAREMAVFFAVGLAGLVLNGLVLSVLMARFGLTAPIAKIPTAGVVFAFNFTLRRALLFAEPAR